MRRLPLVAVFVGVIISCGEPIQDHNVVAAQTQSDETLVRRIQGGDSAAIAEAGKSGNKLYVPYLRRELTDRRDDGAPARRARIALARLGEIDQMQEVWCRAITDDPKRGLKPSTYELESVGGWFAIQGLEKLLTPDGLVKWHKPSEKERNNDSLADPVSLTAFNALPKVIPNHPAQFPDKEWNPQVKAWQDWIAAHKDELSKLQPTGEGVDFSNKACKNGKPTKTQKE